MVSIIIPVYNSEKYINECLDSLLNQTYKGAMEILCVNDGSKDNSLAILNEYASKDSRIKVFTKENEGKGAASARNLGLDNAAGKYIIFLDSDDFFEPDMIKDLSERLDETNAEVVMCRANRYDERVHKLTMPYISIDFSFAPDKDVFTYKDCPEHIFELGNNITWNKMYRKDFLEKYNLRFEAIPISDDQYVPCLALVLAEKLTLVDKAFINYRFNIGTSQVDTHHLHPEAAYKASWSIIAKMREYRVYEDVKKSYLNMAIRLLREYFDRMQEYKTIKFLYDKILNEVLPYYDAENLTEDFFYDHRIWEWYHMMKTKSLEEILFISARGFGNGNTTAILRFQVPYDRFPKGGMVVLVGKGLTGRYWYAQLLLSEYCNVVAWVDDESEIPHGLQYDAVVKAEY